MVQCNIFFMTENDEGFVCVRTPCVALRTGKRGANIRPGVAAELERNNRRAAIRPNT
jgi:hypothetical protein